jgi:hypothetical protein
MTRVGAIGGGAVPARRAVRGAGGFALPDAAGTPSAAGVAAAASPALLVLQDGAAPPAVAEEGARRRGRAALDLLREVQLDLLRGGTAPDRIARLAEVARAAAQAAPPDDPALRAALAEVAVRLRVELARRGGAPGGEPATSR